MSEIFKNLKSLFVESKEDKDKASVPSASSSKEPEVEDQIDMSKIPSAPEESVPGFQRILLQAIEKSNRQGFDYLEFKKGLKSLADMEMDDQTRFKSAFALAQTMGATKENLVDSAQFYQTVLQKEKDHFDRAAQQQMKVKVVGRKEEMKAWEEDVKTKENQIVKLQKEISDLKKNIEEVSSSLDEEAGKVRKTQLDFLASHDAIFNQIQQDIDKMKMYI